MRELSLHILDLVENSVRAGASVIFIGITVDSVRDLLEISVEDNGPGFGVPVEMAFDPFYTTKEGKKTGLGLSLFRERSSEQAAACGRERLIVLAGRRYGRRCSLAMLIEARWGIWPVSMAGHGMHQSGNRFSEFH